MTYIMNQARREFYTNFIEENRSDQGRLFKAAKNLLGKKENLSFPDQLDKVSLVNDIEAVEFDRDAVPVPMIR